jgi:hypothetical protein
MHADRPYDHYFSSEWPVYLARPKEKATLRSMQGRSYKISFQFNYLHLIVAYWGSPGWWFVPVPNVHGVIYSGSSGVSWLPPERNFPSPDQYYRPSVHQVVHRALGISESNLNEAGEI